jgi:putative ABC transport system permease protein
VAVLAAETAATLFPKEDPLGRSIRIGADQYYTVVGIAERRAASPGVEGELPAQEYNRDVYIPFRTDRVRFGQYLAFLRGGSLQKDGAEISQITVTVGETEHVTTTAEVVADLIDRSHDQADVAIAVPLALLEKIEETQGLFNLVLGAIASISLLVGGIGIMNIMLATVSERTREIGIRRALGAKQRDISRQFLVETVVLSGSGGLLGILLGLGLSHGVSTVIGVYTVVRLPSIILACVISVAVGLIFGMYPARRAARLDPIEALRRE